MGIDGHPQSGITQEYLDGLGVDRSTITDDDALTAALADVTLPPQAGHTYLAGEARLVLALRETLAARGLPADQVSPKAYWGLGRANAAHGEPARD